MLRSPYDREIVGLALPALGALAAEPLYVLVDTAIVGHLGTTQLAALAIAADGAELGLHDLQLPHLRDDRARRAPARRRARRRGRGGSARRRCGWGSGSASCSRRWRSRCAEPVARDHGRRGARSLDQAVLYLRIAALGAPFFMLAAAGQGFLRGMRRPAHAAVDPARRAQRQRRARAAVRLRLRLGARGLGVGHGDRAGRDGRSRSCGCSCARSAGSGRGSTGSARCCGSAGEIAVRTTALLALVPRRLGGARAGRRVVARRAPDRVPALRLPRARARRDRDRRRR